MSVVKVLGGVWERDPVALFKKFEFFFTSIFFLFLDCVGVKMNFQK